jgi:hypothetical protein
VDILAAHSLMGLAEAQACCGHGMDVAAAGNPDKGLQECLRAIAIKPDYADGHYALGVLLGQRGLSDLAMSHYRVAIALNPRHAEAHNNLGNLLKEEGMFTDALYEYGTAIEIKPTCSEAHFNRSEIVRFTPDCRSMDDLKRLGESDLKEIDQIYFHFAMAKAMEDVGECDAAFEHLRSGNQLKRGIVRFDDVATESAFAELRDVFSAEFMDRNRGYGFPFPCPIFVIGMPRSGTTLVEQILASHPDVYGCGETQEFDYAIRHVWGATASYPGCVDKAGITEVGRTYLLHMARRVPDGKRSVDKLPGNFVHAGLIQLALPNARIIHINRVPLDTCVSCYANLFSPGSLEFTYDLSELGHHYRRYKKLMDHWRSLGVRMLDVCYEVLVEDLEGQARRILEYCELPWNESCLRFHETQRPVRTASAVQVRKPLFKSSVGRWRKFERHLGPLIEALN